jgi:hypothetical protein
MGWGSSSGGPSPQVERRHYHRTQGAWPSPARRPGCSGRPRRRRWPTSDGDGRNEVIGHPERREAHPLPHPGLRVHGARRRVRRRQALRPRHPGFENAADVQPAGPPARRRLVPPSGIPRRPSSTSRRRPARDRRGPARRQGLRGRPGRRRLWTTAYAPRRAKTFASEVVAADLNKDGTPSWSSAPTRCSATPDAGRAARPRARSSRSRGLSHQGRTATASAWPRPPRSATSPATARSRSSSPPSTTASTSTRSGIGHGLPAVADRARQPAPQRHGRRHGAVTHPRWPTRWSTTSRASSSMPWMTWTCAAQHRETRT